MNTKARLRLSLGTPIPQSPHAVKDTLEQLLGQGTSPLTTYVSRKVEEWCDELMSLAKIAESRPMPRLPPLITA